MIFRVEWRDGAAKETRNIPARDLERIVQAIRRFAETGYGDVKRLQGHAGEYRLRVGEWRVRFALDATRGELVVLHVLSRGMAYRE